MSDRPEVHLNRKMTEPDMSDLLDMFRRQIFLSMNCHHIATIQSFDSSQQTVTATLNYKKSFLRRGSDGVYKMVLEDYPILLDVPVIVLGGGSGHLTFPIAKGDTCLILFNDRDIDTWLTTGKITETASGRLHSFSDGIALVGLNSIPNALSSYDMTHALLKYGTTKLGAGAKVLISNPDNTLNDLLQELVTEIKNLVSATASITVLCAGAGLPSGAPINAAAINAVASSLTTTATKIAGLLE